MATIAAEGESGNRAAAVMPAGPAAIRIEALDFVRGVALCCILLMNITGFGPVERLWHCLSYMRRPPLRHAAVPATAAAVAA